MLGQEIGTERRGAHAKAIVMTSKTHELGYVFSPLTQLRSLNLTRITGRGSRGWVTYFWICYYVIVLPSSSCCCGIVETKCKSFRTIMDNNGQRWTTPAETVVPLQCNSKVNAHFCEQTRYIGRTDASNSMIKHVYFGKPRGCSLTKTDNKPTTAFCFQKRK